MDLYKAATGETDEIRAFVAQFDSSMGIQSTGAKEVFYTGNLYNVTGSTKDPSKVPGYEEFTWKMLMNSIADFSGASCYVTNCFAVEDSSHPGFDVGGHMTPNPDGVVGVGAESYLMPLCKWHNNPARNGVPFSHTETRVVKLTGYMQKDLAFTFALRMGNTPKLLYFDHNSDSWFFRQLSNAEKQGNLNASIKSLSTMSNISEYAIFEKREDNFFIERSTIRQVV